MAVGCEPSSEDRRDRVRRRTPRRTGPGPRSRGPSQSRAARHRSTVPVHSRIHVVAAASRCGPAPSCTGRRPCPAFSANTSGSAVPSTAGVHEHLERDVGLDGVGEQEVDELPGCGPVLGAREHRLRTPPGGSTTAVIVPIGDRLDRRVGEHHGRCRARRVRHHERLVAARSAAGELVVVRLLPAVDHGHAVGAESLPVARPARPRRTRRSSRARTRGPVTTSTGPRPRAGRGTSAWSRSAQRLRDGQAFAREPFLVVVDAHVAVVDRGHPRTDRSSWSVGGDVGERGGAVSLEDPLVERTGEERVVDAEQHVAEWVVLGEDRLVDDLAGVADLEDLHLDPGPLR